MRGKYEIALQNSRATIAALKTAGTDQSGGFHAWNNWRDYLIQFAALLFNVR